MATIASLNIVFRGITGPLNSAVGSAKKTLNGLKSSVLSLSGAMTGLGLGLSLSSVVKAASDAERESRKLESVLKATGNAAGFTSEELKNYAADLQKVTVFEDDATVGAMAVLATFTKIKGPIFKDAVQSAMDMSTIMGTDLHSSVMLLGKALNSPAEGMARLAKAGVQFSKEQKAVIEQLANSGHVAEAQMKILDGIRERFGGAAAADAKTMAGAITQMKNAWGDLAETIGGKLSPALSHLAKDFQAAITPPSGQSSVTKSAATDLNEVQKITQRRQELLKQQGELLDKVHANAQDAQGFSFMGLGAAKNLIEINSLASDLNTINMELRIISEKLAANKKFLAEQKTAAPEIFNTMESALSNMPGVLKGIFQPALDKQKEFQEGWKRLPGLIAEAQSKGAEFNRIMEQHKEMVKAATDSVTSSLTTPLDDYFKRLGDIDAALKNNKITQDQANRAEFQAVQALADASGPSAPRTVQAREFGSSAAFSAQREGPQVKLLKDLVEEQKKLREIQQQQLEHFQRTGEVVVSI